MGESKASPTLGCSIIDFCLSACGHVTENEGDP